MILRRGPSSCTAPAATPPAAARSPANLHRNVPEAARRSFDLVIIGGGIVGACMAMQSAARGLRPLLIERGDFAGATSSASLRIIHGGLRSLQTLDLARSLQSAREQAWMQRAFGDSGLLRPLPCLMPLYGHGLRRPSAFAAAVAVGNLIRRIAGTKPLQTGAAGHLTPGTVSAQDVSCLFPAVQPDGLLGGGLWMDALMVSPERIIIQILRRACALGAVVLNHVEAIGLIRRHGAANRGALGGVIARDLAAPSAAAEVEFRAPVLINCAGPWCREVAARLAAGQAAFHPPSLAFNLLLDRIPPARQIALAISPPRHARHGRTQPCAGSTFLLVPCHGRTMAGTFHLPLPPGADSPDRQPTSEEIHSAVARLSAAAPALDLTTADVAAVYSGIIPARRTGDAAQATRPAIIDHGRRGGPNGVWTISPVKFTTARALAEHVLRRIFPDHPPAPANAPLPLGADELTPALTAPRPPGDPLDEHLAAGLRRLAKEESALHLDDLILRRTAWGVHPRDAMLTGAQVARIMPWDEARRATEFDRLAAATARLLPPGQSHPICDLHDQPPPTIVRENGRPPRAPASAPAPRPEPIRISTGGAP